MSTRMSFIVWAFNLGCGWTWLLVRIDHGPMWLTLLAGTQLGAGLVGLWYTWRRSDNRKEPTP